MKRVKRTGVITIVDLYSQLQVTKQPVCVLLGGRFGETINLYRTISQDTPEKMRDMVLRYREQGYRRFQLKNGGDYLEDISRIRMVREALDPSDILVCDGNTGWLRHDAMKVVQAVSDLDVYIEQPCETYGVSFMSSFDGLK